MGKFEAVLKGEERVRRGRRLRVGSAILPKNRSTSTQLNHYNGYYAPFPPQNRIFNYKMMK